MTMLKQMLFRCVIMGIYWTWLQTLNERYHGRYQGYIGAALVLGGYDATGPHLYTVYPHGSTDKLPYVTMGSGSLAAMSVFESKWKPDMTVIDDCQIRQMSSALVTNTTLPCSGKKPSNWSGKQLKPVFSTILVQVPMWTCALSRKIQRIICETMVDPTSVV